MTGLQNMSGEKSIAQSKIIGKPVYNPNGKQVGTVSDIGLIPGESAINLLVKTIAGTTLEVAWSEVGAVGDIVILSKAVEMPEVKVVTAASAATTPTPVTQQAAAAPVCPKCGKPGTWIPQYQRYYCYTDKTYL